MRLSLRPRSRHIRQGFTLVEMLVVAPIVIIVITTLVAAMVAMVGDALAANSRAATAYDTQDALDRIEQDVRTTVNFMGTFNYLSTPQGRDNAAGAFSFSANKDLILTQQATTGSPYDSLRSLVYYADQPAGCSEDLSINNTLNVRTVYFLKNGSLWRRTLVDAWNRNSAVDSDTVCSNPWQRDSCPNVSGVTLGTAPAATCNTYDEELLKNVTAFTPTFYTSGSTVTTNPLLASSVSVDITTSKVVGGETITQTSTMRAARRNDVPTDTTAPGAPVITQYNPDIDTYNNAVLVSFQWTASKASRYIYQTSTDNVTWSDPKLTTNTWASVDVAYSGRPAYIRVTAYNDIGSSSAVTQSFNSPTWTTVSTYQNGWECYNEASSYPCPAYTLTSSGMVMLRGLIKSGTTNSIAFSMPARLKPYQQVINVASSSTTNLLGRVDATKDGDIRIVAGDATNYIALDNVRYLAVEPSGATWEESTIGTWNNWQEYSPGSAHGKPTYALDSDGRIFAFSIFTGSSASQGNTCDGCDTIQLPANYKPDANMILPGISSGTLYYSVLMNAADHVFESRTLGSKTSWNTFNAVFYRSDLDPTWTALPFNSSNSWANYGGSWNTASYSVRNGIVTLRGLIKNGCVTNGCVIGTLPTGARPVARHIFVTSGIKSTNALADQVATRIDISAAGDVIYYSSGSGASNKWMSLEGISFATY